MEKSIIDGKVKRLKEGGQIRLLDLFAGCGGLSLGFRAAGFKIIGAVEIDEHAACSHGKNLFKDAAESDQKIHCQPFDITRLNPEELAKKFGAKNVEDAVDIIVGGPPCQSFARVGRAKLREVAAHPEAFLKDQRSNLYLRFLEYVKAFKPLAILMENVPDILNFGGKNIAEETCELLSEYGYTSRYTLLNSVFYGVPQMRERMFLIAYASDLGINVTFPNPTHWIELPLGYNGTRMVALKTLLPQGGLFSEQSFYTPPPPPDNLLKPAVTAKEALEDLPPITSHLNGKLKRGTRRFTEFIPYPEKTAFSEYAGLMRTWKGFSSNGGVKDHVIRYLPRDYVIFKRMNPGDQYPEALQHAVQLFRNELQTLRESGREIDDSSDEYRALMKKIIPPYNNEKFPNKWRKMEADMPVRTLMAHLGKDGYSHIHYDSRQARTISVREAARLQSFPDGFVFCGTMNPAFRQIGNAVPPLLSKAIAHQIYYNIMDIMEKLNVN